MSDVRPERIDVVEIDGEIQQGSEEQAAMLLGISVEDLRRSGLPPQSPAPA